MPCEHSSACYLPFVLPLELQSEIRLFFYLQNFLGPDICPLSCPPYLQKPDFRLQRNIHSLNSMGLGSPYERRATRQGWAGQRDARRGVAGRPYSRGLGADETGLDSDPIFRQRGFSFRSAFTSHTWDNATGIHKNINLTRGYRCGTLKHKLP